MTAPFDELLKKSRLVRPHTAVKSKSNALSDWREELETAAKEARKRGKLK